MEPLVDLARTINGLDETLEKSKQGVEALASYREARQLLEQAAGGKPITLFERRGLGKKTSGMAMAVEETERAVAKLWRLVRNGRTSSPKSRLKNRWGCGILMGGWRD